MGIPFVSAMAAPDRRSGSGLDLDGCNADVFERTQCYAIVAIAIDCSISGR
jgi:hypothetical protein